MKYLCCVGFLGLMVLSGFSSLFGMTAVRDSEQNQQWFSSDEMGGETFAEDAALQWIQSHRAELNGNSSDLRMNPGLKRVSPLFESITFEQYINGIQVEDGLVRVSLRKFSNSYRVILVHSQLFISPQNNLPASLTPQNLEALIAENAQYQGLRRETEWQKVFTAKSENSNSTSLTLAWKAMFTNDQVENPIRVTLYISDSSREIIFTQNEIYNFTHSGRVFGNGLPNLDPYMPGTQLQNFPLQNVQVNEDIENAVSAQTQKAGNFRLEVQSPASNIVSRLMTPFFHVSDQARSIIPTLSQSQLEPDFQFNKSHDEWDTSNVEVFRQMEFLRSQIAMRNPNFPGLQSALIGKTNINAECNAYFTSGSISFYRSSSRCNNTAYSSIILHELGHHYVRALGLSQGSFGEGFGDSIAMIFLDTDIVGSQFFTDGRYLRNPQAANVQFPCVGEVHNCGQVLGGIWSEIRSAIHDAKDLFLQWAILTSGGSRSNSATPETAVEILRARDNDARFDNGVSDGVTICRVFANHGISCPSFGEISIPAETRFSQVAELDKEFEVQIPIIFPKALSSRIQASIFYRIHGTSQWNQIPMILNTLSNRSTVDGRIPSLGCGTSIDYYIEITAGDSMRTTFPAQSVQAPLRLWFARDVSLLENERFDAESTSWSADNTLATHGGWTLGTPFPDNPFGPQTDSDGSGYLWLTTLNNSAQFLGQADLNSPQWMIYPESFYEISYDYVSRNRYYADQDFDFNVLVNEQPAMNPVDLVDTYFNWVTYETRLDNQGAQSPQLLQLNFHIRNNTDIAIFRSAVDHVQVREIRCDSHYCRPDIDRNGVLNLEDYDSFIADFAAGNPRFGDYNRDQIIDSEDLRDFENDFQNGCD